MNNFIKILPWGILIVLLGLYLSDLVYIGKQPTVTAISYKNVNDTVKDVKTYKDKEGNEHITFKNDQNVITKAEIKNPDRPKTTILDTVAENIGVAASEIERITRFSVQMEARALKAERERDEYKQQLYFAYSDNYVRLRFTPPAENDTLGNGTFDFGYNIDLDITQYFKRKWFLGAKHSYIDISSKDKRATIGGVRQLTVEQKTPQFGLRLQGSANYNPQNGALGIGPAVRIDLGRFSVQGNYLYYSEESRWRYGIIGNYDLVRF